MGSCVRRHCIPADEGLCDPGNHDDREALRATFIDRPDMPREGFIHAGRMMQMGRNLLDVFDGPLRGKQYLILDRDAKYCIAFRQMFEREGIRVIRLPPRSPNLNAFAERYVRSVKEECLSKLIPIGQGMLRRALREYVGHFHQERNHQGLGNVLIVPAASAKQRRGPVIRRARLGGLLNYYERAAA